MEILDLTPPQLEWRIYAGDKSTFNILVLDNAEEAVDISSYAFEAILKNKTGAEIVNLTVTVVDNSITLEVPVEETAALVNERSYFDLQGTSPEGVTTFLKGTLFVEGDVTN
jgi:hypothetical protein